MSKFHEWLDERDQQNEGFFRNLALAGALTAGGLTGVGCTGPNCPVKQQVTQQVPVQRSSAQPEQAPHQVQDNTPYRLGSATFQKQGNTVRISFPSRGASLGKAHQTNLDNDHLWNFSLQLDRKYGWNLQRAPVVPEYQGGRVTYTLTITQ